MRRYLSLLPAYLLAVLLPLATRVGTNLEYEYALLSAYGSLALIPLAGVLLPKRWLPVFNGAFSPPFAFECLWILLISPLAALLPGTLFLTSKLCACSAPGFAFWMLVLWYPAWVLAHAFLHAVLRARCAGWGRLSTSAGLGITYLCLLGYAAGQLWFAPQKHLLNLFTGFWHGPIYDAWIGVDTGILLTRAAHLAAALLLLFCFWLRRSVISIASVVAAGALWFATAKLAGSYPSSQNRKETLDALLPGQLAGSGFILHYQPPAGAPKAVPVEIQRLARDVAFHLAELTPILGEGGASAAAKVIEIYAYPDRDSKKLWFGGGATDVTDVHTPSVHITTESWPHPTLRHELVHALASRFGYHGLGFHPNMAFTEGLAVALSPMPDTLSLDDGAAALVASGRLPAVAQLFSPLFWTAAGERAYTVAGSFINYLIATHGIAGVKALYSGKGWQEAFGTDEKALISAWQQQITAHFDRDATALYSEALYRYPGVLHDLCPHSKADLARRREGSVFTRMRQPLGWDTEMSYLPWVASLDKSDRETPLKIWRAEIARLATGRVPHPERLSSLRDTLATARHKPPATLEDVEIGILEADLARHLGDSAGSQALLTELSAETHRHYFGDALHREIAARLAIEAGQGGAQALEWRRYLAGWRKTLPTTGLYGEPWLLTYLKLRNEKLVPLNLGDLHRMLQDIAPDAQLPRTFAHEWYRLLANRLMQLGAFSDAAVAYEKAAAQALPAAQAVYGEHARRARFYATLGPLAPGLVNEKT